jgi:hypothetical protein
MGKTAAPVMIVLGTAVSYLIGWAIGVPVLMPILNVLPAYPWMIAALRQQQVDVAIVRMLIWAAAMGICATALGEMYPARGATLFLHGDAYKREMFAFVLTGAGAEGSIRQFLPEHATHAAAFAALAIATGSALAMPLGAYLMNYMGYYVGALAAVSRRPLMAVLVAWVPWAIIRIASFVTLGVVLSGPVLGRLLGFPYRLRDERRWIAMGLAGLLVDVLLKWVAAPGWRHLILRAAGW